MELKQPLFIVKRPHKFDDLGVVRGYASAHQHLLAGYEVHEVSLTWRVKSIEHRVVYDDGSSPVGGCMGDVDGK
jgi:hypothetical protein